MNPPLIVKFFYYPSYLSILIDLSSTPADEGSIEYWTIDTISYGVLTFRVLVKLKEEE